MTATAQNGEPRESDVPEVVHDGLLAAVLAFQAEAPTLRKDATNPHFNSRFASLDGIVETIGPILNRHGLVWMALPSTDAKGLPALTYRLSHAPSGESLEGTMPLLLSKQDAQGQGSALTYARRYALTTVLNLVADDDDDGSRAAAAQAAAPPFGPPASENSTDRIRDALSYLLSGTPDTPVDSDELVQAIVADAGGYFPSIAGRALLRTAAALKARTEAAG